MMVRLPAKKHLDNGDPKEGFPRQNQNEKIWWILWIGPFKFLYIFLLLGKVGQLETTFQRNSAFIMPE